MAELYMETLSIRPSNDRGHLTASTAGHPWPLWHSRRGTIFAAFFGYSNVQAIHVTNGMASRMIAPAESCCTNRYARLFLISDDKQSKYRGVATVSVLIFKGAQDVYGQRGRSGPASLQGMMAATATFQPACVSGKGRTNGIRNRARSLIASISYLRRLPLQRKPIARTWRSAEMRLCHGGTSDIE